MDAVERRSRLRGLYAITPETADTAALREMVAAAIDGGARLVQYRSKADSSRDKIGRAHV